MMRTPQAQLVFAMAGRNGRARWMRVRASASVGAFSAGRPCPGSRR